jgi:hypothetical protein
MQTSSGLQQLGSGRHLKIFGGQHACFDIGAIWIECVLAWQGSTASTPPDNTAIRMAVPATTGKM